MTKTLLLNNGIEIPRIGLGTWQMNEKEQCISVIKEAIANGYRMIDTASAYLNESFVGKALKEQSVPREDLFITSKLWVQNYGYESTKAAFQKSLQRMQLDYLDMYMLHWAVEDYLGSWSAMEELYNEGKIRALGVCNFPIQELEKLLKYSTIKPVINQVETHPLYQQLEMKTYLKEQNIIHESWAPFSQGNTELFSHPLLKVLATKYNKSVQQIILRWHLDSGSIIIPKASSIQHLKDNIDIFDFSLTPEELTTLQQVDTGHPYSVSPSDPAWLEKVVDWKFDALELN